MHETEVESSTISDFVVHIVQTPREQHVDAALDLGVLLSDAKLGEGRDGGGAHNGVLENDTVVDVANVLCRLGRLGTFETEQVQDADGQLGELAVLDEFAEVGQRILL